MSFSESILPVDVRPGSSGGPGFSTTIKTLRGGGEYRSQLWSHPLRMFEVAYGSRTKERIESELQTFMLDIAKGSAVGFRVRDWSDYTAETEYCGTGDGSTYWFRMYKQYGSYRRRIMKPHVGTITVYFDGETADPDAWFIDAVNGTVVFLDAPTNGTVVTWSGEFHVPARFEADMMTISMLTHARGALSELGLKEIRVRENISTDDYDTVREHLAVFDKTDLMEMLDLLYIHVNVNWPAT